MRSIQYGDNVGNRDQARPSRILLPATWVIMIAGKLPFALKSGCANQPNCENNSNWKTSLVFSKSDLSNWKYLKLHSSIDDSRILCFRIEKSRAQRNADCSVLILMEIISVQMIDSRMCFQYIHRAQIFSYAMCIHSRSYGSLAITIRAKIQRFIETDDP